MKVRHIHIPHPPLQNHCKTTITVSTHVHPSPSVIYISLVFGKFNALFALFCQNSTLKFAYIGINLYLCSEITLKLFLWIHKNNKNYLRHGYYPF